MNVKEQFLREDLIPLLERLPDNARSLWGVLAPQGMIEHVSDSIGAAYGRIKFALAIPEEAMEKSRAFMLSDKPFKENTKNILMSETPVPLRHSSMAEAIAELKTEIDGFIAFYQARPGHKEMNAFFACLVGRQGELNYEEQLHLLHKHSSHHLRQFNLV